jgi:hypothetical protein
MNFATAAFDALEDPALRLVPVIESSRRWFLLSIFGSAAAPPAPNGLIDVGPSTPHQQRACC